jgi:spermidine synthase
MAPVFEELDYCKTPMGELSLRRRQIMSLNGQTVYEVKRGDQYLMSSLFYASEKALAKTALDLLKGDGWEVAVGGLGLGYTAAAALEYDRIKHLVIIEALKPVIDWHNKRLVPNSETLTRDPRCVFYHADFFELARTCGFDPEKQVVKFDAILLDIDHSPELLLADGHKDFYTPAGMRRLMSFLKPGGVFALWSNDLPQTEFIRMLSDVFDRAEGRVIEFKNPLQESVSANGIYLAYNSS